MDSEFLNMLACELGEINRWKQECPGVYYLSILPESEDTLFCAEYYFVLNDAPISKEAKEYGTPLENGQGLVFSLEQEDSGAKIIEYEIFRYKVAHHAFRSIASARSFPIVGQLVGQGLCVSLLEMIILLPTTKSTRNTSDPSPEICSAANNKVRVYHDAGKQCQYQDAALCIEQLICLKPRQAEPATKQVQGTVHQRA